MYIITVKVYKYKVYKCINDNTIRLHWKSCLMVEMYMIYLISFQFIIKVILSITKTLKFSATVMLQFLILTS